MQIMLNESLAHMLEHTGMIESYRNSKLFRLFDPIGLEWMIFFLNVYNTFEYLSQRYWWLDFFPYRTGYLKAKDINGDKLLSNQSNLPQKNEIFFSIYCNIYLFTFLCSNLFHNFLMKNIFFFFQFLNNRYWWIG